MLRTICFSPGENRESKNQETKVIEKMAKYKKKESTFLGKKGKSRK